MRVFDGRQAQKQEIHGGLEMKCGKWYDMVHPVQKRMVHPVQKLHLFFDILLYYIQYSRHKKTDGQRIGRVCSCPVARVSKARLFFYRP